MSGDPPSSSRSFGGFRDKLRGVGTRAAAAATASWISLSDSSPSPTDFGPTLLSPMKSSAFGNPLSPEYDDGKQLNSVRCGANLLSKWQEAWGEIHENNEANYEAARLAERLIVGINGLVKSQEEAMNRLNSHLVDLPVLQDHVHNITAKIGSLCEDFDIVEAGLFELENINEVLELQKQMEQQRSALQQHRGRRNLDLEKDRREAASSHGRLMKDYELRLHKKLRERQIAFEAEFKKDLTASREPDEDGEESVALRLREGLGLSEADPGVEDELVGKIEPVGENQLLCMVESLGEDELLENFEPAGDDVLLGKVEPAGEGERSGNVEFGHYNELVVQVEPVGEVRSEGEAGSTGGVGSTGVDDPVAGAGPMSEVRLVSDIGPFSETTEVAGADDSVVGAGPMSEVRPVSDIGPVSETTEVAGATADAVILGET